MDTMNTFLGLYKQQMDDKAKEVYDERFLEVIRHVQTADCIYISGKVQAEIHRPSDEHSENNI